MPAVETSVHLSLKKKTYKGIDFTALILHFHLQNCIHIVPQYSEMKVLKQKPWTYFFPVTVCVWFCKQLLQWTMNYQTHTNGSMSQIQQHRFFPNLINEVGGNMQNKLDRGECGGGVIWHWWETIWYGEGRGDGSGINKQTLTRAAAEDQPGEQRGLRSGADGPVFFEGGLPSADPEPRHSGAAWLR